MVWWCGGVVVWWCGFFITDNNTTLGLHWVNLGCGNNAKFSGHYVCPRTETVRAHALRSHQFILTVTILTISFPNFCFMLFCWYAEIISKLCLLLKIKLNFCEKFTKPWSPAFFSIAILLYPVCPNSFQSAANFFCHGNRLVYLITIISQPFR